MEGLSEMHFEENNLLLEKNAKRRFKTPAQVRALEEFYNEHKYPTEEMKLRVAEEVGLTEKQVSGWFCHRRLKDKKSDEAVASGRQDRSSGIGQDRGSGLRQDSCGSTKLGEQRSVDVREVESRRLYGHDYAIAADLAGERRNQFNGDVNVMDDTSSESSSFLQDRLYPQIKESRILETSRIKRESNEATTLRDLNIAKTKKYKPSGYLKMKGDTENAAITAVKRQLGRHYREDGPPLSTDFDPLPPGAFELANSNQMNDPSYLEDARWSHSPDLPAVPKHRSLGTRPEVHGSHMDFDDSFADEETMVMHGSDSLASKSRKQSKQRSSHLSYPNPSLPLSSYSHLHDEYDRETPVSDSCYGSQLKSKHDAEETRLASVSLRHDPHGGKITGEKTKLLFHDSDISSPNFVQRSEYLSMPSYVSSKPLDAEERGQVKKIKKVGKLRKERTAVKGQLDPLRVMMHPVNKMTKVAKRVRQEIPQQEYVTEPSYAEFPSWTNQTKGSTGDMPCSFSEDETAETSSSKD